jgi:hypothetical protein
MQARTHARTHACLFTRVRQPTPSYGPPSETYTARALLLRLLRLLGAPNPLEAILAIRLCTYTPLTSPLRLFTAVEPVPSYFSVALRLHLLPLPPARRRSPPTSPKSATRSTLRYAMPQTIVAAVASRPTAAAFASAATHFRLPVPSGLGAASRPPASTPCRQLTEQVIGGLQTRAHI